jgi:hypothetical protein
MKPEIGKQYNLQYTAPDKRSTSYTGIGEYIEDAGELFVFCLRDDQKGLFAEQDIISEYKESNMKENNVVFNDSGLLEKTLEKHLKQISQEGAFEDVGLKLLFKVLGPNNFACRAVYEVTDNKKFVRFALYENLSFFYTSVSTREEYDALINRDPLHETVA